MSPWRLLCAYNRTCRGGHHPFQKISNLSGEATIDFWGPWLVVSAYGAVLWLARVNNVPWVYAIWILTATFNHLICRVWYLRSSILFHCALLGYSLAPAVPLAALVCLMRSWEWLAYLLQYVTVLSAAVPAVLAYQLICGSSQHFATNSPVLNGAITSPLPSLGVQGSAPPVEKKAAVGLLVPPVILMLLYLVSLLPV